MVDRSYKREVLFQDFTPEGVVTRERLTTVEEDTIEVCVFIADGSIFLKRRHSLGGFVLRPEHAAHICRLIQGAAAKLLKASQSPEAKGCPGEHPETTSFPPGESL